MSRGDRQKDIYVDDADRQDFLKTLPAERPVSDPRLLFDAQPLHLAGREPMR